MADVKGVIKALTRVTERLITKITLDVTANLIQTTPIDTGWARANWVPSIGSSSKSGGNVTDPQPGDVSGARGRQSSGQGRVAAYKLAQGSVFVTNNVRYIRRLNSGSSKQAPSGFVQRAIRKALTSDIKGFKG